MTEYRKTDAYEDMAATFQAMMIHWLNETLEGAGIREAEKRREICYEFGFVFSIWKDQYWFKDSDGNRVFPCIAFSTNGPAGDLQEHELGVVYLPSELFSFKEYLNGNLMYYFEENNEDISMIESSLDD